MITAIVDLQFGSTGKGLIAGYLSQKNNYDVVVSANMPNAGHTFVDQFGHKWINKVLPSGVYSPGLEFIMIGPGAVFDIAQLDKEIKELHDRVKTRPMVLVHPNAGILLPQHKEVEQNTLSGIASTMQGSMEAMFHKMRRGEHSNIVANHADDVRRTGAVVANHRGWMDIMAAAKNILVEGSQGYSLGINAGFYPYCTSRDCTVHRLLADCGVSNAGRLRVVGTARVHPIRVGNTSDGYSGPFYHDQKELTWEMLGQTPETTTVTGRIRRVFSFSVTQIREAMLANNVDDVFLNFCNYDARKANSIIKAINQIGLEMATLRGDMIFDNTPPRVVKYLGFGPQAEDVFDIWDGLR